MTVKADRAKKEEQVQKLNEEKSCFDRDEWQHYTFIYIIYFILGFCLL